MKNFVFISPNFPTNYWKFCRHLKDNGINVLGIGDQPYYELLPELRSALSEYYKVDNMENYDSVYRAVAYFIHNYGRIDWLESNNEYWLMQDARLRTDFNITSGFQLAEMDRIKYKSKMKAFYEKAGITVARYHMVDDFDGCKAFLILVQDEELQVDKAALNAEGLDGSQACLLPATIWLRVWKTLWSSHTPSVTPWSSSPTTASAPTTPTS